MAHCVLDSKQILNTIGLLQTRIVERFPGSGLGSVCGELRKVAMETHETIERIQQRHYGYRLAVFTFVFILAVISVWGATQFKAVRGEMTLIDLV